MPTLTVIFEGLMTQVGNDADEPGMYKKHVALVDDRGHKPLVSIDGSFLVPPDTDLEENLKKEDVVTFVKMGSEPRDNPTPASTDDMFQKRVPHLKPLLKGGNKDMDREIKDAKPHGDVVAYVKYDGGSLTAPATCRHPAYFKFKDGAQVGDFLCVARIVVYTVDFDDGIIDLLITHKNGTSLRKKMLSNATVRITNVSQSGKHFHLFEKFMDADEMANAFEDKDQNCPLPQAIMPFIQRNLVRKIHADERNTEEKGEIEMDLSPHPECTNSNWP